MIGGPATALGRSGIIRVLVADDFVIVREGVKHILANQPDIELCAEAGQSGEALRVVRSGACDLVLLDISSPAMSGLDLLKHIKTERPRLPVIVLSLYPESQLALRAFRSGAAAFLTLHSAPGHLISAVRTVIAGRKYVSPSLGEVLADGLDASSGHLPHESLSDREFQVLRLLASGNRVTDIAEALAVSPQTVSTYRARVLRKMGLRTNADLIRYSLRCRLAD